MRTRILPKLLNDEVEEYLQENDIIIVPVGTVEMHGGFPLDCETTASEAIALKMAQACNGLVLTGLPYFYAGATTSGRGTVQVSVRTGIDYLYEIAESLYRQGFHRQIYLSCHGPAHLTISPVVRDFMDRYGTPILYIDLTMQMLNPKTSVFNSLEDFHSMIIGAYKIMNRLEDIPLTKDYEHSRPSSLSAFQILTGMAYESGACGYYFGEKEDHMSTPAIDSEFSRQQMADDGEKIIEKFVQQLNVPNIVEEMRQLKNLQDIVMEKYPWTPASFYQQK